MDEKTKKLEPLPLKIAGMGDIYPNGLITSDEIEEKWPGKGLV